MAIYHKNLIEDKPNGCNMGWALAYLIKANGMLKSAKENQNVYKALPEIYRDRLNNL